MKCLRWTIVIAAVLFVCLSSIIPRVDSPETAYNETNAPVNLTTPPVARTNVIVPAGHFVAIPREQRVSWEPGTTVHGVSLRPVKRVSHSLLDLHCSLLC
jgi:hypothetical protein